MTDFDKSQLLIQQKQNQLLEMYEGKVQTLLQEKLDTIIDEDTYKEQQEEIRRIFLYQFNETLKEVDLATPEIHFRNMMTKALLAQVKRAFGCYQAVENLKPVINQYNMQLGEQVLESEFNDTLNIIEKIEKVQLVLDITEAMKLPQEVAKQIVSNVIDKEFPVKSRQAT
jgi:hypothetical protein